MLICFALVQFSEFIDNSLKACKDMPSDSHLEINTFVLQEELPDDHGLLTGLIVFDSGTGMRNADMERWRHRGEQPVRSAKVRSVCQLVCERAEHRA